MTRRSLRGGATTNRGTECVIAGHTPGTDHLCSRSAERFAGSWLALDLQTIAFALWHVAGEAWRP
jgi:hypothetical protein